MSGVLGADALRVDAVGDAAREQAATTKQFVFGIQQVILPSERVGDGLVWLGHLAMQAIAHATAACASTSRCGALWCALTDGGPAR